MVLVATLLLSPVVYAENYSMNVNNKSDQTFTIVISAGKPRTNYFYPAYQSQKINPNTQVTMNSFVVAIQPKGYPKILDYQPNYQLESILVIGPNSGKVIATCKSNDPITALPPPGSITLTIEKSNKALICRM